MFVIVGTGGHAKVVCSSLRADDFQALVIRDDNVDLSRQVFMGASVQSPSLPLDMSGTKLHVAIGDNYIRERLLLLGINRGALAFSVLHPSSNVQNIESIASGSFVGCGAVVAIDSYLGIGSIVNHNAVVDHDCSVGSFCHVAPGAVVGGNVRIGNRVLIGSGSTVLPNITIEDDVIIGSGSVVTRSVSKGSTWIGNKVV